MLYLQYHSTNCCPCLTLPISSVYSCQCTALSHRARLFCLFWRALLNACFIRSCSCPGTVYVRTECCGLISRAGRGGGVSAALISCWMTGRLPLCFSALFCWATLQKYSMRCQWKQSMLVPVPSLSVFLLPESLSYLAFLSPFACGGNGSIQAFTKSNMDSILFLFFCFS